MAQYTAGLLFSAFLSFHANSVQARDIIYPDASLPKTERPANPVEGLCYGKFTKGAVYETKLVKTEVRAAEVFTDPETGVSFEIRSAEYSEDSQVVQVSPRQSGWFETPCSPTYTAGFVRTLQRSLAARGYLSSKPTGILDDPTRAAIKTLQVKNGLPSAILATSTARALGLIAITSEQ